MFGMFSRVAKREAADLMAVEDRYFELLEIGSEDASDDPALEDELREAMAVLGKNAAQVSADAQLITQARQLQRVVRDGTGLAKEQQQANAARNGFVAETERIIRERVDEQAKLGNAIVQIDDRRRKGSAAAERLTQIKATNAALLRKLESIPFE